MEKQNQSNSEKSSTKFSKMLQRAMSIGHSAAPFSPGRDFRQHRTVSTAIRGSIFSGQITPLVPISARTRRRNKNDVVSIEPTSPKVSCIGQIKSKCPEKNKKPIKTTPSRRLTEENFSKLKRFFSIGRNSLKKPQSTEISAAKDDRFTAEEVIAAPPLSKMKKFASNREGIKGFDWTVEMKREESTVDHHRGGYDLDSTIPFCIDNLWKKQRVLTFDLFDRPKPLEIKAS